MTIVIITILALSIITVRRLSRSQAIVAHMNVDQQRNRKRRTMAAVSMVLASVVLYSCCWFPYSFLDNLRITGRYFLNYRLFTQCIDWSSLFYITSYFLPALNSCLSPVIYIIFIPDFREAAERVLCRCKPATNQQAPREEIELPHFQY